MRKHGYKLLFVGLFLVLAYNVMQMPGASTTDAPSYNELAHYVLDRSVEETGSVNTIAAVLADYRAFDTLGETIVLFTSIVAVASILKVADPKKKEKEGDAHE